MARIVFLADAHVDCYAGGVLREDGANSRLMDVISSLTTVVDLAGAVKADAIVCCGDLVHDRKAVRSEALHQLGIWLEHVAEVGVPLHLLVGNHDLSSSGVRAASLRALRHASVYDERTVVDIAGTLIGFVPYTENPAEVRDHFSELAKKRCSAVCAHLGIGDPRYANTVPIDYEAPGRIAVSDLRPDDFAQVFLGHYHRAQDLTDRLRYIGSPLQLSFKEAGEAKRVVIWDTRRGIEAVGNDLSPRYHIVRTAAEAEKIRDKDFVKIRPQTRDDEADALELVKNTGRPMHVERVQSAPVKRSRIDAESSDADMIRSYVSAVAKPDDDQDALVSTGEELLHG